MKTLMRIFAVGLVLTFLLFQQTPDAAWRYGSIGAGCGGLGAKGAGIKSIQSGIIGIGTGSATNTATITSVDTNLAILLLGGWNSGDGSAAPVHTSLALTNATTVTGSHPSGNVSDNIRYIVIEYDSGITSIQRGSITINAGSASNTATISAITVANAVVIWLGSPLDSGVDPDRANISLAITNSTTITATRGCTPGDGGCDTYGVVVNYQVVEY